jgi:hypothetical protein
MANRTQTVVALTLIAVGASGLFGLRALAAPGASVPPLTSAVAAPASAVATPAAAISPTTSVDPAFKETMREMLKERMGLTGPEADKLVDSMAQHMQAVHGDQAGAMLDQCSAQSDTGSARGTRGASGSTDWNGMMGTSGGGMMGGSGSNMMGSGI